MVFKCVSTFNERCIVYGSFYRSWWTLIAIALTLGGETTSKGLVIPDDSFWKSIENIGSLAFKFMVPILAGYIAVSIADKPGLVPGMIGGAIAADGSFMAVMQVQDF